MLPLCLREGRGCIRRYIAIHRHLHHILTLIFICHHALGASAAGGPARRRTGSSPRSRHRAAPSRRAGRLLGVGSGGGGSGGRGFVVLSLLFVGCCFFFEVRAASGEAGSNRRDSPPPLPVARISKSDSTQVAVLFFSIHFGTNLARRNVTLSAAPRIFPSPSPNGNFSAHHCWMHGFPDEGVRPPLLWAANRLPLPR